MPPRGDNRPPRAYRPDYAELLEKMGEGVALRPKDQRAIERYVRKHILFYLRSRNLPQTEDNIQDAWVRVLRKLKYFRRVSCHAPGLWLRLAVRDTSRNEPDITYSDDPPEALARTGHKMQGEALELARYIPDDECRGLLLRIADGATFGEAARALGLTRSQQDKRIRKLKDILAGLKAEDREAVARLTGQ